MKSHLINVPDYYCYNTTLVSEYCIAMPAVWDGKGSSNCLLLTTGVAIYHNICTSPLCPHIVCTTVVYIHVVCGKLNFWPLDSIFAK